ncbi:MAG: A/G-specific adenine glycosylase [Betaproteobacteria bacterium]|nr:A/G-specific adenine glycosylase [Betaproteobacteria bacterium]
MAGAADGDADGQADFAAALLAWQRCHGRHDLPWQGGRDPYRIWLSEVMLQQTRVATVVPYFQRFVERFPDVAALAAAPPDAVLGLWSGLGYYARARNLHRAARAVMERHGGRFPRSAAALAELPGIGRSTAAAVAVFAFGERAAILDGNVRRVLARCFGVEGWPGERLVGQRLWGLAASLLPQGEIESYTQGLMDLGATLCLPRRPRCGACPVAAQCVARRDARVAELPAPRPRRVVPEKVVTVLVLRQGDGVLLERRPATGVWGGLMSLPELPEGEDAAAWAAGRLGLQVEVQGRLAPVRHGFTHFRLEMRPLLCAVRGEVAMAGEPLLSPVRDRDLAQAALPAPVRRLLEPMARPSRL